MTETEILEAAESIYTGWYAGSTRVDWQDFIDRLEIATDVDFGNNLDSPLIRKVKKHIRDYQKQV
jgi:hypothetical protein